MYFKTNCTAVCEIKITQFLHDFQVKRVIPRCTLRLVTEIHQSFFLIVWIIQYIPYAAKIHIFVVYCTCTNISTKSYTQINGNHNQLLTSTCILLTHTHWLATNTSNLVIHNFNLLVSQVLGEKILTHCLCLLRQSKMWFSVFVFSQSNYQVALRVFTFLLNVLLLGSLLENYYGNRSW